MDEKEILYEALIEKKKRRGLEDLYYFNKFILENDPKRREMIVDHVHGEWAKWYEGSKKRIKLVLVPRGTFKCVSPNTLIQMWDGSQKEIQDIEIGDSILGFDGFDQVKSVVTNIGSKVSKLYKFKFRSGRDIIASDKHMFLQLDGYKPMPNYGAYPRGILTEYSSDISRDEASLVAYFVTEGCLTGGNMSFTNNIPEVRKDFERIIKSFGWNFRKRGPYEYRVFGDWSHSGPRKWARDLGLWGKSSFDKTLPSRIMSSKIEVLRRVIEILFATDGHLDLDKLGRPDISYCSVNKRLCDQVQNILNRFQIYSTIRFYRYGFKYRGFYRLSIEGKSNVKGFVDNFNVLGKADKMDKIRSEIKDWDFSLDTTASELFPAEIRDKIKETGLYLRKNGVRIDNKYRISRGKIRRIPSIANYADIGVNWDDVISTEFYGEELSYDIETTSKNYVANGIITHNSTFFTVGRTIQALAQNRNHRILLANATLENSKSFLTEIKTHLKDNPTLNELYGQFYSKDLRWNDMEIDIVGRDLGVREPSVSAAGVGGNLVSRHYSIIVADDLVNLENSMTRYQSDKVVDWWKRAFSLLDYDGEMLVIGTRWSYYELYSWMLDNMGDDIDFYIKSAYNEDGSAYFPEMLGVDKLNEIRGLQGSYIFSSFYLNDPVDDESALIKKSHIKKYRPEDVPKAMNIFCVSDPAVSQETSADHSCILTVGVTPQNDWYVLEVRAGRWTVGEFIDELFLAYGRWKPITISLELIGLAQGLSESISEEENRRNIYLPIFEIKSRSNISKEVRIRSVLQPRFERGKIYIGENMPDLEEQLLKFPKSKRDDLIDALSDVGEIGFSPEEELLASSPDTKLEARIEKFQETRQGNYDDPDMGMYF